MTKGPRDYSTGTERALFRLADATCYFPGCSTPIMTYESGEPIVAVEIAHICGAKEGSARFDSSMSDLERASFGNLILLCTPHHKLVDRIRPNEYPVDVLKEWKQANEPTDGLQALNRQLNDANLEDILERFMAAQTPVRLVEVDLLAGIALNPSEIAAMSLDDLKGIQSLNPSLSSNPRLIFVNIRNVGSTSVSVEDVAFYLGYRKSGSEEVFESALLGRNDFPPSNPPLPYRLPEGDAVRWLMKAETLEMLAKLGDATLITVTAQVQLASGEKVRSSDMQWLARD
ncbi:hypothetical protein AB0L70_08850 [Kribbella sp. NPDC051952]|uniref:hypothetical protein n=1 Tax=Kribbella sp. NPDC051952 TaxID=3154851 RepID=UPI00341CD9B9